MKLLSRVVKVQLKVLEKVREGSVAGIISDYEQQKALIVEILESVDEARVQFEVCASALASQYHHKTPFASWPSVSGHSKPCMRLKRLSGFVKFLCSTRSELKIQ